MTLILSLFMALNIGPVVSDAPNRQPQLAASGSTVAMVFGSGHAIYLSTSQDFGRTFSTPEKILDEPALHLGRHRGPRILFSGKTMVVSAVGGTSTATSDLLVWRSQDTGKTWSKPSVVNDVAAAAREGLDSMAVDSKGVVAAVWLDLRQKGTRLYGSFSNDAGATWSKNVMIYESPTGTICECCDPSIAAVARGEFAIMWRNSLNGTRDLYLTTVRDGKVAAPARKLGTGSWKLAACPMDGGGVGVEHGIVQTAWRRENVVYLAAPDGKEDPLGTGKDVAVATGPKGFYVAWAGTAGIEVHMPGASAAQKISAAGAFPALAALGDGSVMAAWEENGSIQTKRIE